MNLYTEQGYLNFPFLLEKCEETPFIFIIGGRGTGKTFGALKYATDYYEQTGKPFIFMRRTQTKADIVSDSLFSPYKALNEFYNWNIEPFTIGHGLSGYYHSTVNENGKLSKDGKIVAYIMAMSTFSNVRGFDASNIDYIFYDEFIKMEGEKSIKSEGFILKNIFETVNRNRELSGKKACKLVCMANSDFIANDVFIDLNLVGYCETMIKQKRNYYFDFGRGIAIFNLFDSPVSQAKRDTALYRLDNGGSFTQMSLENKFMDYTTENVKSVPLIEYIPLCKVGELVIYKHKSTSQYYISNHVSGRIKDNYDTDRININRFLKKYCFLWDSYLNEKIVFQTYLIKKVFENLFLRT